MTTQRTITTFEEIMFIRLDYLLENERITMNGVTIDKLRDYAPTLSDYDGKLILALWRKNHNKQSDYSLITVL